MEYRITRQGNKIIRHKDKMNNILNIKMHRLLFNPNFSKPHPFHCDADASDDQLGAILMQDKKALAICSRKLITSQKLHITIESKQQLKSDTKTCKV
jgi:hypothetical protein